MQDELTIGDKPIPNRNNKPGMVRSNTGTTRPQTENIPPGRPSGHRPMRSQEEAMRARRAAAKPSLSSRPREEEVLDIFADPNDSPRQRARRNSDTSIMERKPKLLDPEDQRRRLEKEKRHRDRKRAAEKAKKKAPLDVIDQLDATSIFGIGSKFNFFFFIILYLITLLIDVQHSIMMGHSMPATQNVIEKEVVVHQCKPSLKIQLTIHLVVEDL